MACLSPLNTLMSTVNIHPECVLGPADLFIFYSSEMKLTQDKTSLTSANCSTPDDVSHLEYKQLNYSETQWEKTRKSAISSLNDKRTTVQSMRKAYTTPFANQQSVIQTHKAS